MANVAALEKEGVFALWQFAGTGTVREVATVAASRRIPLVGAVATGPQLRAQLNPYTFYVRAGNSEEIQAVVDHLLVTGITRIAAVCIDAPYGEEGIKEVQSLIQGKGHQLVSVATIKTNGDGSEEAVKKLMEANPQAVVMITVPASSKAFVLAAKQARLKSTLYSLNAGLPIGAMQELGESAHGVVVTQVMPNPNRVAIPVVREYQEAYRIVGGEKHTSASIEGFINAKVMVEGLRRAGRNLTREGLVQALEGLSAYDAGGYRVHFSKTNHNGNRTVELSISGDGGKKFIY